MPFLPNTTKTIKTTKGRTHAAFTGAVCYNAASYRKPIKENAGVTRSHFPCYRLMAAVKQERRIRQWIETQQERSLRAT